MKKQPPRRSLLALSALVLLVPLVLPLPAQAADKPLPARNLWVELRWVEGRVSAAAVAGVRDGALVLGTDGAVSPRGQILLGTQGQQTREQRLDRLLVLNGRSARIRLEEQRPLQWLDYQLRMGPDGQGPARIDLQPRELWQSIASGFSLTPRWPGGGAQVEVELHIESPQPATGSASPAAAPAAQQQLHSTVALGLGQWLTIARSGQALQREAAGTLSSRSAEAQTLRELQLRVDLAP